MDGCFRCQKYNISTKPSGDQTQNTLLEFILQGVRAKSIHICNKDLSVFYETNMAIDGSILFKILSAFRICPFFKAQTIIECIRTV